jgi:hypothetical protein
MMTALYERYQAGHNRGGRKALESQTSSDKKLKPSAREIENVSRGSTFGGFVTILTERSMQEKDITVEGPG